MEAALICSNPEAPMITPEQVMSLLDSYNIVHGIVSPDKISQALENARTYNSPVAIAKGYNAVPGTPRHIEYFFDIDPLRVGKVKEGGDLDFKERGEIPQVQKGQVIAQVVEGLEGIPGMDVFGQQIEAPKVDSIKMMVRVGKGAAKSEDGSAVVATTDGRPMVTGDGRLFVFPGLTIPGDVNLETGHIRFEGAIDVKGVVQDGFEVVGGSLTVKEIGKSTINVKGDLVVQGGILGANIQAGGTIKARHIYGSTVEAVGDILVEKQILDSRVITTGACLIPRGKILSSGICAKNGVDAMQVGSEASKPCTLLVGVDERLKREIDRIKAEIEAIRKQRAKKEVFLEEIRKARDKLQENVGRLAQVQDQALVATRDLERKIQENDGDVSAMTMRVTAINQQSSKVGEALETLLEKQERISEDKRTLEKEGASLQIQMDELKEEIEFLLARDTEEPGTPILKTKGTVFMGTAIKGAHASLTLPEDMTFIRIKEKRIMDENERPIWIMEVSRQKA
ncbi:MAG: DUF342 domain-containing protein [Desulfatibacillum sp.]|nr:DUF342 domain-containing protein [Desulfatibacillum sp.]